MLWEQHTARSFIIVGKADPSALGIAFRLKIFQCRCGLL